MEGQSGCSFWNVSLRALTLSPESLFQLSPIWTEFFLASFFFISYSSVLYPSRANQSRRVLLIFFFFLSCFPIAWESLEGICILSLRKSSITQILKLFKIIYWEHVCWQKAVSQKLVSNKLFHYWWDGDRGGGKKGPKGSSGRPTRGIKCFPRNTLLSYWTTFPI